jgi:membrane dipeptidase
VAAWRAAHPPPHATLAQVADQIEYVRRIVGADHVGIGGDFDGITDVVVGLEDVSKYPALFAELAHRGWSDDDLRKLAGENILRVFSQAEQVAARLQKSRPPSTRTIAELDGPAAAAKNPASK